MGCDTGFDRLLAQHTAPPESVMAPQARLPSKSRDCSLAVWERGGEARHVGAVWVLPGHSGVSIQIAVLPILDRLLNPWGMGQPSSWAGSVQGYRVAAGKRGPPCGLPAVLGAGGTAVSSLARLNQQTQG